MRGPVLATLLALVAQAPVAGLAESPVPVPQRVEVRELTSGEQDDLRVAVQACWAVAGLSPEAAATVVTLGVEMSADARPVTHSITLVSATGGTPAAVEQAYQAARRAVVRCGAQALPLPAAKYDQWRQLELTFDATGGAG